MFCKDSPFSNYHLLCRPFRRSKIFSRPGIWRSKGCSEVKGWSKYIIHSGQRFLTLKSFTSFRPVLIFSDWYPLTSRKNCCEALFDAANTPFFNKIIDLILAVLKAGRCSSLKDCIPPNLGKTLKSMNGTGNSTIIGLSVESVGIRIKHIIMNLNNLIGIVDLC